MRRLLLPVRVLLPVAAALLVLGGCSGEPAPTAPAEAGAAGPDAPVEGTPESSLPASPSPTASPSSPASPSPLPTAPPVVAEYEPADNEVYPNAKRVAGNVAQAVTTFEPGTEAEALASTVTDDPDRASRLAEVAAGLLRPDAWSRGTVEYPQLGGVRPDRVSVMVVVRQEYGNGAELDEVVIRTIDVRLRLVGEAWEFDRIESIGGAPPVDVEDLSPEAEAVLADDRIGLPDSARWDIQRGEVDPNLLELMRDLAEQSSYEVIVLSSGHPFEVFGTDVQSNHTKGRAVDFYIVDGIRVIDAREDNSLVHDVVRWLYDRPEVTEVGSPWALDGFGGRSFTDVVHQDHVHVGVRAAG